MENELKLNLKQVSSSFAAIIWWGYIFTDQIMNLLPHSEIYRQIVGIEPTLMNSANWVI